MEVSVNYIIDGHKINYHPDIISKFMNGNIVDMYPANIEISPSGSCNLRCIFCAQAYQEYKPEFLNKKLAVDTCQAMWENGLKALEVAGEGEPLLNPDTPDMLNEIKRVGVDVGLSTNGILLSEEICEHSLASLTWTRISLNAGSSETYNCVHGLHKGASIYDKVLENISCAVNVKKRKSLDTTIGVQLVLIPENSKEVIALAKELKKIGVDYFSVKPFSKHPKTTWDFHHEETNDYCGYNEIRQELISLQSEHFAILARERSMKRIQEHRKYSKCHGIALWAYISSNGDLWPCLAFIGDSEYKYGNLYDQPFLELWKSENRKEITRKMAEMNISDCRKLCRLEYINEYLEQLAKPPEHINFI
jgi:cyclic pyranopterin phosphate synthase